MARVNVSEERIELTAVDKASAVFRQVSAGVGELRSSLDTVKNALAAVGVIVGAGAMGKLFLDIVKSNAALVDFAAATGSSIETLSKLQTIAKIGGADFEGFTAQLGKMVRGLKSGDEDGQKASQALKFLGIQAKDANGVFKDTGEITIAVARALSKYADDGNKLALIQDILGKDAERYAKYLKDIVEFGDEAGRTTGEQARQAKEYEVAINRLNIAFEDMRRGLVNEYTPTLTRYIEQMREGIKIAGGFWSAIRLFGSIDPGASLDENIARTQQQLKDWQEAGPVGHFFQKPLGADYANVEADLQKQLQFLRYQKAQLQAESGRAGANDPNSPLFEFAGGGMSSGYASAAEGELKLFTRALQQLEEETGKLNNQTKEQIVLNRVLTGSWKELSAPRKAILLNAAVEYDWQKKDLEQRAEVVKWLEIEAKTRDTNAKAMQDMAVARHAEVDEMRFQASQVGATAREREQAAAARRIELDLRARVAALPMDEDGNPLGGTGVITSMRAEAEQRKRMARDEIAARQEDERSWVTGTKDAFSEYIDHATNAAEQARMLFSNAFRSMEDGLVQFVKTGKLDFRSFADSIITDIIRINIQRGITAPLAAATQGFFTGLASSFAGGGVMTSAGPMPLRRYASGGVADGPQLAMFGEGAQPEAYVPLPDGRRIPVQMQGGGGNTTVNKVTVAPVFNLTALDTRSVAEYLTSRDCQDAILGAVNRAFLKAGQPGIRR